MRKRLGGQSLVEIILAIAIFVLSISAIAALAIDASVAVRRSAERSQAIFLAQEEIEATRSIRDANFSNLTNGQHGISLQGNAWGFSGTVDAQDIFLRSVLISTSTPQAAAVTSTVLWLFTPTSFELIQIPTLLTNWQRSERTWFFPRLASTIDLPGSVSALSVAVTGTTVLVGRAQGAQPELAIVNAASSTAPSLLSTLEINDDVNAIAVTGTTAYLVGNSNATELYVVDISNPSSPSLATSTDLVGNGNGLSVAILGNKLYITRSAASTNPTLQVLDISTLTAPSILGGIDLGGGANDIALFATGTTPYAAVASQVNSAELQIVDVSNPASLSIVGTADIGGNQDANGVAVSGTTIYIGTDSRTGVNPEFSSYDASNPASPIAQGSLLYGGDINGLRGNREFLFGAGASNPDRFFVVDPFSSATPTVMGTGNPGSLANGIAVTTSTAYVVTAGVELNIYTVGP